MTAYILLLLYALMIGLFKTLARNTKVSDKFAFACVFTIMIILAMFRGETVGADTDNYIRYFQDIRFLSFGDLVEYSRDSYNPLEYGYKLYNWLLVRINASPQVITVVNSLLFMTGLFVLTWNESEDKWLSLFIFLTLGFYQTALNMTPSFIAAFIAYNGIKYIRKKNLVKYIICIVLAMQMHTAAVLFLPLYWADKVSVTRKRLVVVACVAILLTLGYGLYSSWLGAHVPSKYQYYFTMAGTKYEQLLVCAVQVGLICVVSRYVGTGWIIDKEYRIDVWIIIVRTYAEAL